MRERPDLVNSILSSLKTKHNSSKSRDSKSAISPVASTGDGTQSKQPDACLDSEKRRPRKPELVQGIFKDDFLLQLRWKSSRKRTHRSGRVSYQKLWFSDICRRKSPKIREPDAGDSYVITATLKVDHDDCKYAGGDPSIFSSSVVPSLTNLVMCR